MTMYRQCFLVLGDKKTVSWIPEKFAKIGKYLKLKNSEGSWINGWLIKSVNGRMTEDEMRTASRSHKGHRSRTDI